MSLYNLEHLSHLCTGKAGITSSPLHTSSTTQFSASPIVLEYKSPSFILAFRQQDSKNVKVYINPKINFSHLLLFGLLNVLIEAFWLICLISAQNTYWSCQKLEPSPVSSAWLLFYLNELSKFICWTTEWLIYVVAIWEWEWLSSLAKDNRAGLTPLSPQECCALSAHNRT